MLKIPVMSKIFDVVEESRAKPNGRSPFVEEIKIIKDVVYKTVDGKDLVMDVYLPANGAKKAPVVLEIPGGGWMTYDREIAPGVKALFADPQRAHEAELVRRAAEEKYGRAEECAGRN